MRSQGCSQLSFGGGAHFGYNCEIVKNKSTEKDYFVADIEHSTLLIRHGVRGMNVDKQGEQCKEKESTEFRGRSSHNADVRMVIPRTVE